MNRPKFPHPLGESRHARRYRRRGAAHPPAAIPSAGAQELAATLLAPRAPALVPVGQPQPPARKLDADVQRVQAAGGPIDHASYNCACGYLFSADVSTSVICPHCGTDQAW
jgi:hypothetical protein